MVIFHSYVKLPEGIIYPVYLCHHDLLPTYVFCLASYTLPPCIRIYTQCDNIPLYTITPHLYQIYLGKHPSSLGR